MKRCLKVTAILMVLMMIIEMLPVEVLGERITLLQQRAAAEEARAEVEDRLMADLSASFEEIAALAEERLKTQPASDNGEWQYIVLPEYNYAVVTGHTDKGAARVDIPATLGGADVVAMLSGVFAGHSRLLEVTFAVNLYYAAANAVPRGVTVRGYHGSYAQNWAEANRYAFTNLSELDFVTGVVDCSDIAESHFTRRSAESVSLRALEANRLQVGSVFFLPDPDNLYQISFYRVVTMNDDSNTGFVQIACETPDISDLLLSYSVRNAPLVADISTLQLEPGMILDEVDNAKGDTQSSSSGGWDIKISVPEMSLGSLKFKGSFNIKEQSSVTTTYGFTGLKTYTQKRTTTVKATGTASIKGNLMEDKSAGMDSKAAATAFFKSCLENHKTDFKTVKADQPLASVGDL